MGMLSPVGLNVEETWQNILAGVSGVGLVEDFDTTDYSTKFGLKSKILMSKITYLLKMLGKWMFLLNMVW